VWGSTFNIQDRLGYNLKGSEAYGERSVQSVKSEINPSFENDTNVVMAPPSEATFANCEKVVKSDVEIHRKNSQFV